MEANKTLLNKILATFSKQEALDYLLAMSVNWDGYKRENAVRCLGMLGNPMAIPKLIVRANDWVPQVRIAAKQSLEKLLTSENAEAFVLSLPDLYHLQNCGRDDHKQLITNITHFLLEPNNIAHIKSAIKNDNSYIARIAVKLCIEHSLMAKQALVSEALSHRDVVIRNMASNLLRDFTGQVLESFLQTAIQDPFMPIRREAFQIYLRVIPETGLEIAHRFLFDRHSSIREIAITKLLKNNINVALILTDVLLSANQSALKIRCAILDLAYIGAKQSIPLISRFANNALPSIRKACLQALAKLAGEEAKVYLLTGLKDESANVAKESTALLNNLNISLYYADLLNILESTHYSHTLTLLNSLNINLSLDDLWRIFEKTDNPALIIYISKSRGVNRWDRFIFLLRLFRFLTLTNRTELEIMGNGFLSFFSYYQRPSATQIEQVKIEYNQCKPFLNAEKQKSLEFQMFPMIKI